MTTLAVRPACVICREPFTPSPSTERQRQIICGARACRLARDAFTRHQRQVAARAPRGARSGSPKRGTRVGYGPMFAEWWPKAEERPRRCTVTERWGGQAEIVTDRGQGLLTCSCALARCRHVATALEALRRGA